MERFNISSFKNGKKLLLLSSSFTMKKSALKLKELDEICEKFLYEIQDEDFDKGGKLHIDFEVTDAVEKLLEMGLIEKQEEDDGEVFYKALPLDDAIVNLKAAWERRF